MLRRKHLNRAKARQKRYRSKDSEQGMQLTLGQVYVTALVPALGLAVSLLLFVAELAIGGPPQDRQRQRSRGTSIQAWSEMEELPRPKF